MDLEMIILSGVGERQTSYDVAYMWNLKKWYKWTYLQNRNTHRCRKQTSGNQEGDGVGGGVNWEVGIGIDITARKADD